MKINQNYGKLKPSYLFSDIARKVAAFAAENPGREILRLGIGDVTRPLAPVVVEAMREAAAEMGVSETFRGYGDEQGYLFLREAIVQYYATKGVDVDAGEIYVGDGAKCDIGNLLDIFDVDNTVLIPDPVYPAYLDANVMAGRKIIFMNGTLENGFLPMPDENTDADIIYLCSPNNPTGAVYTRSQLETWVDFAIRHGAVIFFDAAYECFVRDKSLPTSIFEIPGARKCAIEICSFSKTAGFTGVRCGYTLIPAELEAESANIGRLWLRRQTTKFNGVSYIVQRGAAAALSPEGLAQCRENRDYYLKNAALISEKMTKNGVAFTGGGNAPYIWLKCPDGMGSWEYFEYLLKNAGIVGTPGAGFGRMGEGYMRLTAFGTRETVIKAMEIFPF